MKIADLVGLVHRRSGEAAELDGHAAKARVEGGDAVIVVDAGAAAMAKPKPVKAAARLAEPDDDDDDEPAKAEPQRISGAR